MSETLTVTVEYDPTKITPTELSDALNETLHGLEELGVDWVYSGS